MIKHFYDRSPFWGAMRLKRRSDPLASNPTRRKTHPHGLNDRTNLDPMQTIIGAMHSLARRNPKPACLSKAESTSPPALQQEIPSPTPARGSQAVLSGLWREEFLDFVFNKRVTLLLLLLSVCRAARPGAKQRRLPVLRGTP